MDPDGDAVAGFGLVEHASAVGCAVREEEVHYIFVADGHCLSQL